MALQIENTQILCCLQSLLIKTNLLRFNLSFCSLSLFYQVFICGTHMLSWLHQFYNEFWTKLVSKGLYKVNLGGICLRLTELQANNQQTKEIKAEIKDGWENINEMLHF